MVDVVDTEVTFCQVLEMAFSKLKMLEEYEMEDNDAD